MKRVFAALIPLLMATAAFAADSPRITQEELVRRSQQMYDAVAPGDQAPWKLYYAEDALFFDEKGRDMDKKALLADLQPMPKGYSGSIRVVRPKARFAPNVAILSYDSEETEFIFGQELHARYHSTDTWLYRNHLWQIVASQTLRYYEDPAAGATNAVLLDDYVGTYELTPGTRIVVSREGDELYAQRGETKKVQLLPESTDLFFRVGVEGRRLFHRDDAGKVNALYDRRNNEDVIWKRIR